MTNRERLSKEIQAKYLEIGRFVANFNALDARLEVSMADSLDIGGLPIGLAHGVRLKTPIAAGRSSPAEERPGQEGRDGGGALLRMGLVLLAHGDTEPPSRPQRHDRRLALALADSPVPLFQILATPDAAAYGRRRLNGFCTFATRRVGRNDRACGTRRSTRASLPHGVARRSRIPSTPDTVSWKMRSWKSYHASGARPTRTLSV